MRRSRGNYSSLALFAIIPEDLKRYINYDLSDQTSTPLPSRVLLTKITEARSTFRLRVQSAGTEAGMSQVDLARGMQRSAQHKRLCLALSSVTTAKSFDLGKVLCWRIDMMQSGVARGS